MSATPERLYCECGWSYNEQANMTKHQRKCADHRTAKLAEALHATDPAHAGCERRYDEHGPSGGGYYKRWAEAISAHLAAEATQ